MSAAGYGLDTVVAAFVPLADAAVLVAARGLGFAQQHGIELRLVKEPSWASLRDHLNLGHVDCTHALAPLSIAAALGIGQVRSVLAVPLVLGRGGNAITVSNALADELRDADGGLRLDSPARTAHALAAAARRRGGELRLSREKRCSSLACGGLPKISRSCDPSCDPPTHRRSPAFPSGRCSPTWYSLDGVPGTHQRTWSWRRTSRSGLQRSWRPTSRDTRA